MASEFFTILTAAGRAKIAAALAEQKQIVLQTMVVGDGGGQYAEPKESQTKVVREVWRGSLNTLKIALENPAWVIAEAVLPEAKGGWYIREVGLLDMDGVLIAIGKFPETYKPKLPAGASKQIVIRAVMEVTNAAAVTLMVDPSLVMATVDYVDSSIEEHERSHNHPDATLTQKGFTQLNSSTNSTLETQAATPKAVKAAMDKANEALEKAGADKAHKHPWADITGVPDGTTAQKGVVKLNSSTNSTSTTEAATPSAVKAAYDLANGKAAGSHKHAWGDITGVPDGTTAQKGIVKLNSATNSTSTTEAATPGAVKAAYDLANGKAASSHTHAWSQITGVPDATTAQKGVVKLNSATNSTSTTEAATPSAVKAAYDKANTAISSFALFTSNGTFTVPVGVTKVMVEMIGGGGGGGGGGVGGGERIGYPTAGKPSLFVQGIVAVNSGQNVTVTVGGGGVGGSSKVDTGGGSMTGSNGYAGGNSIFLTLTSVGGSGGGALPDSGPGNALNEPGSDSTHGYGGGTKYNSQKNAVGYGSSGAAGTSKGVRTVEGDSTAGGNGASGFVRIWW
ncbi:tail fiber protein [Escherichia coli]|nr:phage tail protein [Escherichia coli]EJR8421267.1 tail fiber protein [Escherichia coli]